jgi:RNA polymerase sigma factor (sigma-70 family)
MQPDTGRSARHVRYSYVVSIVSSGSPARSQLASRRVARAGGTDSAIDDIEFEGVYRAHYVDVFRYVLVLTRNVADAEDVAAEAFERAYKAWKWHGIPSDRPLPWLFLAARRISTDRWRRARRVVADGLGMRAAAQVAADVERSDEWLWLTSLAAVLSPRQREVILLRFHRDLSHADIAKVMGLTPSGARSLLARAIHVLREHPEVWK